jgi:Fe-S cluster assembly protein SufD
MMPLAFNSLDAQLSGTAANAAQRQAWARFREIGLPSRQLEHWRYTDLGGLVDRKLEFFPPADASNARDDVRLPIILDRATLGAGVPRVVFVDGRPVPELSDALSLPGVSLESAAADTAEALLWLEQAPADAQAARHPLVPLNTALTPYVTTLRVAAHAQLDSPVHCLFVTATPGHAWQPRLRIELGESARAVVVQHFIDLDGVDGWTNGVCEITQAAGSALDFHRFQEHGPSHLHTGLYRAELAAGAALRWFNADCGGRLARTDVDIILAGAQASAEVLGLLLPERGCHMDTHVQVDHAAPSTRSRQTFRAVVGERARAVINGKVIVRPQSQGIDATQASDGLLLSEHGEIDLKPELEIYADNVKCSHGATVGEIDPEQLFYLCTRGLPQHDARNLLTLAFVNHLLQQMGFEEFRAYVARHIAGSWFTGMDAEALR